MRLAVAGGRSGLARIALTAAGVGLGVAILLGVLSVGPAHANRIARAAAQSPSCSPAATNEHICPVPAGAPDRLEVLVNPGDSFRGRALTTVRIAVVGSPSRFGPPPGVSALPRPGQLVVSPALARLLTSKGGVLLRPRLPGQVVGTIGNAGLVYPGQLLAYAETLAPTHPRRGGWETATGFGAPAGAYSITGHAAALPTPVLLFLILLAAVVLAPILAFTVTATRLSAATRQRRLATLRLLGAPPSQVRLLVATESGLAAALGCVLGAGVFLAGRQLLPLVLPAPLMAFPSAFSPPWPQAAAVLLAVPFLALAAGFASLRRVELSALEVRRRARPARRRRTGALRLVPVMLGLAGLAAMLPYRHSLLGSSSPIGPVVVIASVILTVGGVIASGPWIGLMLAGPLAKRTRSPGMLLGARRLQLDPASSSRVVGGVVVVAFAATVVLGIAPVFSTKAPPGTARLRHGLVTVVSENVSRPLLHRLAAAGGVRAVVPVEPLQAQTNGQAVQVSVLSCAGLHELLASGAPSCTSGVATGYYPAGQSKPASALLRPLVAHPQPAPQRSTSMGTGESPAGALTAAADGLSQAAAPFQPFNLPARLTPARLPPGSAIPGFGSDLVLTSSAVPTAVLDRMLAYSTVMVLTNGSWQAHQRIRDIVAAAAPGAFVIDSHQITEIRGSISHKVGIAVGLGLVLVLVVAAAGLLVGSLDAVAERRRPLAVLCAAGVPRRTLAASVAVAIGLPLLGGLAIAEAAATAAGALFELVVFSHASLDLVPVAVATGAGLVAVTTATLLTMPSLARATGAEGLRVD